MKQKVLPPSELLPLVKLSLPFFREKSLLFYFTALKTARKWNPGG